MSRGTGPSLLYVNECILSDNFTSKASVETALLYRGAENHMSASPVAFAVILHGDDWPVCPNFPLYKLHSS